MSEPEREREEDTEKQEEQEPQQEQPQARVVQPPALPLDWTQLGKPAPSPLPVRYPHDVAVISPEDLDICIVGTAGQKITFMDDDFYTKCNPSLESLILRSHLIEHIKGIEGFTKLNLLELYDNQLQELGSLEGPGPNLKVLDMSYNAIRDMMPVSFCANLTELCKKEQENEATS